MPRPQAGNGFLAEASRLLADSLDYETTLNTVASLSLPYFGAWCIVDVCLDGDMRRTAVIHTDPAMQALARGLESGWPPERDDPFGVPRAIRTQETEVIAHIPDEMLVEVARGEENLQILRSLGMGSLLIVPLRARGEVLGAITYVSPRDGRVHGRDDVALAEDLASRCAIALDNARLHREALKARQVAEGASAAKSQFLAIISHELRTPLTAIIGFSDLIDSQVSGPVTSKQREQVSRIRASAWHLVTLVDEVLAYSRMEAGAEQLRLQATDAAHVAREVVSLFLVQAQAKGLELRCAAPEEPVVIRTDPGKLRQIVTNLLGNAIKFTEAGRGELELSQQDDWVEFRVRDTGPGIAFENQERIFEPFVQVESATTRRYGGTGLGLAISRRFARMLGGDIMVESEPGQGSTFTLHVPHRVEEARLPGRITTPSCQPPPE